VVNFKIKLSLNQHLTPKGFGHMKQKQKQISRGDIYYADLNPVIGSEQGDNRPVLVVQNNVGNKYSPTIVVAPITCKLTKRPLPTHVIIPYTSGLDADSLALMEQIRTIDRSRLNEYIGRIDRGVQSKVDYALAVCVGIDGNKRVKSSTPIKPKILALCLCLRCEGDFIESGYVLVKKGWQDVKKVCYFCGMRQGLVFGVISNDALLPNNSDSINL